jgi:hypothetical protein
MDSPPFCVRPVLLGHWASPYCEQTGLNDDFDNSVGPSISFTPEGENRSPFTSSHPLGKIHSLPMDPASEVCNSDPMSPARQRRRSPTLYRPGPKMTSALGIDLSEGYAPHQKRYKQEHGDPWPEQLDQTDGGATAFHHGPIHFIRTLPILPLRRMIFYQKRTWFIIVSALKIVTACSMIRLSFFREEV